MTDIAQMMATCGIQLHGGGTPSADGVTARQFERFANLVRAATLREAVAIVQAEIDHAAINDVHVEPHFGQQRGEPGIRASALEAALAALAQQNKQGHTT